MEKFDHPEIGAKIKLLRGNSTQGQFAEMLGVSQASVSKWEKGMMPPADILFRISREMNIPMESFFTQDVQCVAEEHDPYIASVTTMMRDMDDETKKDVQLSVQKEKLLRELLKEKLEKKAG